MTESTEDRAAVQRLAKITFDYSSAEDRLLARVQPVDGEPSALWMTQRLARRLVGTLCAHLDKTAVADRAASLIPAPRSASGNTADLQQKEMLLNFRREAAAMNRKATAPVPAIATDDAPLLQTIRAQLSQNRVLLTLELPAGPAVLPLTQDHVWQLLQVLLNLFCRAEWPIDVWPAWMREADTTGKTPEAGTPRALH